MAAAIKQPQSAGATLPIDLTTGVTGILPSANGGTANGFVKFSGPASTEKTFTLPNANATILTTNAAVTAAQGGTGLQSYTIGDLIQASGATTLAALAAVATGNALISGGVGTVSAWGKIGLTTHVSGTLPAANGGTGIASYAVGDIIYASGATTLSALAAVVTGNVLRSGGVTTAPAWGKVDLTTDVTGILPAANGGNGNGFFAISGPASTTKTFTFPNASATVLTSNAAVTAAQGGTGFASYAVGDILYADTTTTLAKLADVATGSVLISGGVGVALSWSASPTLTTQIQVPQIKTSSGIATSNFGVTSATAIAAQTSTASLLFGGALNVQYRSLFGGTTSTVLTAASSYAGVIFGAQTATEATSGTHAVLANVAVLAPVFTDGSATTTDATTLYIAGAPTGTATITNTATALWVASGLSRFDGAVKTISTTVAGLPSASASGSGARAFVTDASTTVVLGLGGAVTGGGANKVPVYSDGTNWLYG